MEAAPESPEGPNVDLSNIPLVSKAEWYSLKMMEKMIQLMGQLTPAISPRENYSAPEFKTQSMQAPYLFDGTHAHKLTGLIQSFHVVFHNYLIIFFPE